MPFSMETIEDFDQQFFNKGAGWAILYEIWMGISMRAKITSSSVQSGAFARQLSGPVWLQKQAWATPKNRNDYPSMLNQMYVAIETLLSSPITTFGGIRWTESSGRSTEWTIESLTADIGLGDFRDLITRPQNPAPLVWLVQALNRLRYPKIYRTLYFNDLVGSTFSYHHTIPSTDLDYGFESLPHSGTNTARMQEAWDDLGYKSFFTYSTTSIGIGWSFFQFGPSSYACNALKKLTNISLANRLKVGGAYVPNSAHTFNKPLKVKCLDYEYRITTNRYNGDDFVVKIGTSPETNIGKTYTPIGTSLYLESATDDLDFAGTKSVTLELLTERPSTMPFSPYTLVLNQFNQAYITVSMPMAWVYCELPEVMGVGELESPIPAVSGND